MQISIPEQDALNLLPNLSRSISKMADFPVYAQRDDSVEMFHLRATGVMHDRRSM